MIKKATKWTLIKIETEAKKYTKRRDFAEQSGGAYNRARQLGILDDVCSHMPTLVRTLTSEEIYLKAKSFVNRTQFQKDALGHWRRAVKLNILDNVCSHMEENITRWDVEKVSIEMKKYKNLTELKSKAKGAYHHCRVNGLLGMIKEYYGEQKSGFDDSKPAILYYLSIDNGAYYKIGITNRTVEARLSVGDFNRCSILFTKLYPHGADARQEERRVLSEFKDSIVTTPVLHDGNTEIFTHDVLGVSL